MSAPNDSLLPVVDPDSRGFWEAAHEHRLVAQQCSSCSKFRFPPSPLCDNCRSWEFTWEALPELGKLYSWVVARQYVVEEFSDVPYVIGLVEFGPGIRIPGRMRDVTPESVYPDMALSVQFRDMNETISIPEFWPASTEA